MKPVKDKQSKLSLGKTSQGDTNPVAGPKKGGGLDVDKAFWNLANDESAQKDYAKKGSGGEVQSNIFRMADDKSLQKAY